MRVSKEEDASPYLRLRISVRGFVRPSVRATLVKIVGILSVVRVLEKASSYLCCPCLTVAASVGRVSGLVFSKDCLGN